MLLYRFMQVIMNHLQNQKMFPQGSGLEFNGKIYVVKTSKFQRECFAPRKQKIEGNTLRPKRRTKRSPTRSSTPGGFRRGVQRGVRREVSWGFSRRGVRREVRRGFRRGVRQGVRRGFERGIAEESDEDQKNRKSDGFTDK